MLARALTHLSDVLFVRLYDHPLTPCCFNFITQVLTRPEPKDRGMGPFNEPANHLRKCPALA